MDEVRLPTTEAWLERVEAIGPILDAEAPESDRAQQLTDRAMAALHEQSMLRLLVPRVLGGHEISLPQFFAVVEKIAQYDGSAAWVVGQGNACAMLSAYLDPPIAEKIWLDNPTAVLAWGPGKAEARAVDGGYSVTVRTMFASGSHHATWLAAHCPTFENDGTPRLTGDGAQENRTILIPASETTLTDNWDVVGLRGTGSDGFVLDDYFVPEEHTIVRATMVEDRPVRSSLHRLPLMSVYPVCFGATALGLARGFVDGFVALAREKKPRGISVPLSENPVVHDETARAEARLSAAHAFLRQAAEEGWRELEAAGSMSIERRVRIRLAGTHAIHEAKATVDTLYDTAGTSVVFADSPFVRRFRDVHTVALQIQGRKAHYQLVGGWMFGQPIKTGITTYV